MSDRIVTIEIDPATDSMTVDTDGFHGKGCKAIHEAFESMGKVVNEVVKPEYSEANNNQNTLRSSH